MKKQQVIMIGPSLAEKGGMGSVETLIMNTNLSGFEIQHISTWDGEPSKHPKLHILKLFVRAIVIFLGKLLTQQVDLVHIHFSERGSVARKSILLFIALAFNKPVIIHAHGCEFHIFHSQLPKKGRQLVNWSLQKCTRLIVLSESWKDYYINNCEIIPEKVVVLPNPVDIPDIVPERTDAQKLNVLFLGKINQRKGVFDLLEALAKIPSDLRQNTRLILAGSGEVEQARKVAQTLDIEKQVEFPGWVNENLRNHLLARANIFVLPSYNEGLPMALLEAMSWELPVITTPVGGIPEVITHQENGLLVSPGDIEQLTEALQSLLTDASFRLALGIAARKRVLPLDTKNYSLSLWQVYCSTIRSDSMRELLLSNAKTDLQNS